MRKNEGIREAAAGFARNEDLDFLKNGEIKGLKPGAKLFEEEQFGKNRFKWSNDFHAEFMKRAGATEEEFEKLVMSMPRNMGAMIMEFVKNQQRYERDARNNKQQGLAAGDNETLAKNPGGAFDALKTAVEQLAASSPGRRFKLSGRPWSRWRRASRLPAQRSASCHPLSRRPWPAWWGSGPRRESPARIRHGRLAVRRLRLEVVCDRPGRISGRAFGGCSRARRQCCG